LYLVVFRPWVAQNPSVAASAYSGAAAMLALATFPKGTRLVVALAVALAIAFLVLLVGRELLLGAQA